MKSTTNTNEQLSLFAQPLSEKLVPEVKPLTVLELTTRIRGKLEPEFQSVLVMGEISNYRPAASGHVYFSLKDEGATIAAVFFGWNSRTRSKLFDLKDGLKVVCHGKLSVYPPRGNYQLTLDNIEPSGLGSLHIAFEQLKAKLNLEGMFKQERKRKLPILPIWISVVTSPSGAAIQDMLNILGRRAPNMRISVIPAIVQGEEASS